MKKGKVPHIRAWLFDALFLVAAACLTAFLSSPQTLIGSNEPTPSLFPGDTTQFPIGQPPQQGIIPPGQDNKGGYNNNKFPVAPDTTKKDSTRAKRRMFEDTTYVICLDSTFRLKDFTYVRKDQPQVQFFPARLYPLFAPTRSATYQRQATLDSSGKEFRFSETVMGTDVKIPLTLSFHDYLVTREKAELRKMLADEARKPKVMGERNDLGELLSNFTKINIPVPANPIFSIFGKNNISLNISGAVDIKAGFRTTKSDQTQISVLDQSRSEPDFQQEVQVNVNGMIGDKLSILADWNTQRTFEYENQLKIKYTGYDDEIVQSVEAGNVSLSTPSQFIGSSQALFGIKAKFQTGPLTLTTLASQKKGQIKELSVSGGAQETPFEVLPYNYSTNHFFVDASYESAYEPYYQSTGTPVVDPNTRIYEEEVWVELRGTDPTQIVNSRQGIAYIDLPARAGQNYDTMRTNQQALGTIETGRFIKLDQTQYDKDGDGYVGVISLNTSVQDDQIVAIAYRLGNSQQFGEFTRDIPDTSRVLVLKMLKPRNLQTNGPSYRVAWDRMLKNIYYIGGRNVKEQGFTLDIFRQGFGQSDQNTIPPSERLLRVFGFDKFNSDNTPAPNGDNLFDFRPGITINTARAEIIFPFIRPFDDGIKEYFDNIHITLPDTSSLLFPQIYDTTRTFAQQNTPHYYIRGKATGDVTSKYQLGFNVVEGSVQVLLDGRRLVPNVDYTVDYIVGEVDIRNDRALVPGANLQIKYEQNDLFQLASKTLLGARGDLAISKNINLGFTIMNLNQQTLSDKVRLGEEPNKNTIFGFDSQTQFDLPFLTNAIDALPLLETREMSTFRISGEAAYMLPDPNTMKSTIPSDNGAGVAYIDDFEGARRTIPLGVSYTQWYMASPPDDAEADSALGIVDTLKMFSKGKTVWYNDLPTKVKLTDVYPRKVPGNEANNTLTVLDLQYYPRVRGMYNYSPNLDSTLTTSKNWGGIMKPVSIASTNLIDENINFIEFWLQLKPVENKVPFPRMRIDLGTISEAVIPNRPLRTEDLVLPNSFINGTLQEGEDVGLDMMNDGEELRYLQGLYGNGASVFDQGDPSGDDYAFDNNANPKDFSRINGTEGNKNSPNGLIPDTEDLNSNGVLDDINQYLEYDVSLDTSALRNPAVVGGGNAGWYQFRIPVRNYTRLIGGITPNYQNVQTVRLTFLDAEDTIAVRIADISLVGNQWQELYKGDSTFSVSVVSVEDNPDYQSPPGVIRERDKTQPDQVILANEQSLTLLFKGVPQSQSRQAVKFYDLRPLDVFNYREMKMFVYGDPRWSTIGRRPQSFFRFGFDSLNYYEYRGPIFPGWDPRNEIDIKFSDLTAIKQLRDSLNLVYTKIISVVDGDTTMYRILGNPSLTQIRYLAVGVANRDVQPLVGQAWYDELRLIDVDDTPGWAYRMDTQVKLADLGTVSFNYSKVDPNFHTLEDRFGSRQTGINWALSASAQLEKFFPNDWVGTSFPVSYSRSVSLIRPKYLPNSDVLVEEAASLAGADANEVRLDAETYRVTDTYAAPNFKLGLPSQAWYIRDTFNKLAFGFNYTKSNERNPTTARHLSWSWNSKISYALNFSPDYFFQPFKDIFNGVWLFDEYKDLKIYYTPTNFTWSLSAVRSRDVGLQRVINAQETITRNFTASRQFGFGWKLTEGGLLNPSGTYNLSVESSLQNMELDRFGNQRPFSRILNDIFFSDKLINFGTDTRYAQQNQFSTRPAIPNMFNIKKYLDLSFSYSVDYSWQNTLTSGDLGKSAGWNNNINMSMNFKLKQLFDPLFEDGAQTGAPAPVPGARGRGRGEREEEPPPPGGQPPKETPQQRDTTAAGKLQGPNRTMQQLKNLAKLFLKIPLLDYDNINVTFTQTNSVANSGVVGSTGFVNFWGRLPFQDAEARYGPSRLYQLGLISDPSGSWGKFGFRPAFPFFGWGETEPGIRAPFGQLQNTFRQQNRVSFKTTRNLWEGARVDLNWNIGWSYSRTVSFATDSTGFATPAGNSIASTGSVERSYLSFPDVFFLGIFKSSLKDVSKRYAELKTTDDSTASQNEKLAQAFEQGFEAMPILRKIFGQYYPRVNWTLRWDGLEKIPLFAGFASRVSLEHAYSSTYSRQFENSPISVGQDGVERTTGQRVLYGFAPLVGLNFTFKELLKGSFGSNIRYNTNTSFDLSTSSQNIVEQLSQEISVTLSYSRRGFEIPFFGLSLDNDLDISGSYSLTKNSRTTYDISKLVDNITGTPLEGSTRTVIEPRIKYVLSSRVTASVYYRFTKIEPDASGSLIPGSTVNEAGLDIHIAIQ